MLDKKINFKFKDEKEFEEFKKTFNFKKEDYEITINETKIEKDIKDIKEMVEWIFRRHLDLEQREKELKNIIKELKEKEKERDEKLKKEVEEWKERLKDNENKL